MKRFTLSCCVKTMVVLASVASGLTPLAAQTIDVEVLRRKQEAQQRARDMARELVSGILDVQLQQLEENGLQELPLFRDISQMRSNIDGLVEAEMNTVVTLLLKAQEQSAKEREATFVAARQKIRDVVVRLTIERQNLLRRLKAAELAAQVKRLIGLEMVVLNTTDTLPQLAKGKQESTLLSTVQDQRDVKALYLRLVETLQDVRGWGGEVGHGAADGLTILKTLRTDEELDSSIQKLEAATYADAQQREAAVIKGLRMLLEKIEETQGLVGADREAALEMVRDLIKEQEKVREQTKQTELTDANADPLVQKQTDIQKELSKLPELLNDTAAALPLAEQAKAAARAATSDLFEAKRDPALADQKKVLANLAEIERQILSAVDSGRADKSAEEYGKLVKDLEKTRDDLKQAQKQTAETKKTAEKDAAAAKPKAEKVSTDLAKINEERKLPPVIEARIKDAADAAQEAAQSLDDPEGEPDRGKLALENTKEAIERASAEVEAALADAKRQKLAVEVGELARAAEALDRAAAAERNISEKAVEHAKAKKVDPQAAAEMAAEQQEVNDVVKKVAEAVKDLAPETAEKLADAGKSAHEAGKQLDAAQKIANPQDPSKAAEAPKMAQQAGEQAKNAAEKMAAAANDLRKKLVDPAKELIKESDRQLARMNPVREAAESAAAKPMESLADRLENLAKAEEKVREAAIEQQRASGRKEAADAMDLGEKIAQAAAQQQEAKQAANDLAQGKSATPLDAAIKQQRAAEAAAKAGEQAAARPQAAEAKQQGQPDELTNSLQEAGKAAAQAAKETLDGNAKAAKASQQKAEESLAKAAELAQAEAAKAARSPAGKPDPSAQKKVAEAAAEASKMAAADAPEAKPDLAKAQAAANAAEQGAQAGKPDDVAKAQQESADALEQAKADIKAAQKKLAEQEAQQMARQSVEARELAGRAAAVDPPAQAALKAAEKAAAQAAEPGTSSTPQAAKAAEKDVSDAMERAVASLSARQQRIEQDKKLAEAMIQANQTQQVAAKEIATQREALEQMAQQQANAAQPAAKPGQNTPPNNAEAPQPGTPPAGKPSPAQQQAAQKLAQAMQNFAKAQQVTGQAAQEVSGQEQVANQPLREALEIASNLETPTPPGSSSEDGQTPAGNQPQQAQGGQPHQAGKPESSSNSQPGKSPLGQSPMPGQPTNQSMAQNSPHPGEPGAPKPSGKSAAQMGTQFTPASPDVTAQMLAGQQALQQLAASLPQPVDGSQPGDPNAQASDQSGQQDGNQSQSPDTKSKDASKSQTAGAGSGKKNEDKTGANAPDGRPGQHIFREEPWVAKLPPELRDAIRAQSERRPPRGYEETLRRYFQNID